jgi:urease accessory protein
VHYNNNKSALFKFSSQKLLVGISLLTVLLLWSYKTVAMVSTDWNAGFQHPLQGWDHLLTMLAVGFWAAQLRGHAIWMLPLAFVGVMSLGGIAGAAGLAIPSVEGLIVLSCAVFSILIVRRARFSTQVNVLIVAFFAFFHGFAHGHEISTSASLISYTFGFMLATLLLHGAGIVLAKLIVLSVTCLAAIFFSSITQANYAEAMAANKSKNIPITQVIRFNPISPLILMGQLEYGETCDTLADHHLCTEAIHKNRLAEDGNSALSSKANRILSTIGKLSPDRVSEQSKVAGNFHSLPLIQATLHVQANLQPIHQIYHSNYLRGNNFDFKNYYPDINHTPGKDLLSNGVGLTSPPELFVNLVVLQKPQPFCNTPVSSFEERNLQVAFAKPFPGNSSVRNKRNPLRKDYAFRNLCNALEHPHTSGCFKPNLTFYLTPINPFHHQNGLAVGAIYRLDLLSVLKKSSRYVMTTWQPFLIPTLPTNH